MSWSISASGTSSKLRSVIERHADTLTDRSKEEFEAAQPHLLGLVDQNSDDHEMHLSASGHANFDGTGKKTYSQCRVTLS